MLPLSDVILIQRIRCTNCGHTTNVLPSFLLARKRYQVSELKELIMAIVSNPHRWKKSPDLMIDLSTAYRWLRILKQQALPTLSMIRQKLFMLQPDHPVMDAADVLPEPLISTSVILKRFLSIAEQLFKAAMRLVDQNNPENDDLFCFLNYFLARQTGKALLVC